MTPRAKISAQRRNLYICLDVGRALRTGQYGGILNESQVRGGKVSIFIGSGGMSSESIVYVGTPRKSIVCDRM